MTEQRRVFFAFWPPPETLQALDALAAEAAKRCGGRRMRRETLHMTLAFIGAVSPVRLALLRDIGGKVCGEAFDLRLDRIGCWPRKRIVWAGCSEVPSCQDRLFETLKAQLKSAGFILDPRPFVPHVTLVRDARCDSLPELSEEIHWRINELVLVESLLQPSGARYRLLDRWPLSA